MDGPASTSYMQALCAGLMFMPSQPITSVDRNMTGLQLGYPASPTSCFLLIIHPPPFHPFISKRSMTLSKESFLHSATVSCMHAPLVESHLDASCPRPAKDLSHIQMHRRFYTDKTCRLLSCASVMKSLPGRPSVDNLPR